MEQQPRKHKCVIKYGFHKFRHIIIMIYTKNTNLSHKVLLSNHHYICIYLTKIMQHSTHCGHNNVPSEQLPCSEQFDFVQLTK